MVSNRSYLSLAVLTTVLAFTVVVVGAYVRLSHAGLACPDWPGCYGQLVVPSEGDKTTIDQVFPARSLDRARAWKEMVHRYLAGTLGLSILALALLAIKRRRMPGQQVAMPLVLTVLVIFQALLGMWTVTWLLQPFVVVAHLLGGFFTLALLWWLSLRQGSLFTAYSRVRNDSRVRGCRLWVAIGMLLLAAQIALGGWTSANYAAFACPDFPLCQGALMPTLSFAEALSPWQASGLSYEGGVLTNDARVTIHFSHRIGALVNLLYLGWLGFSLRGLPRHSGLGTAGLLVLLLLGVQVSLGIGNVILGLPLPIAVAHNGTAALLLLSLVTAYHMASPPNAAL